MKDLAPLVDDRQHGAPRRRHLERRDRSLDGGEERAFGRRRVEHEHAVGARRGNEPDGARLTSRDERTEARLEAPLVLDRHAIGLSAGEPHERTR